MGTETKRPGAGAATPRPPRGARRLTPPPAPPGADARAPASRPRSVPAPRPRPGCRGRRGEVAALDQRPALGDQRARLHATAARGLEGGAHGAAARERRDPRSTLRNQTGPEARDGGARGLEIDALGGTGLGEMTAEVHRRIAPPDPGVGDLERAG